MTELLKHMKLHLFGSKATFELEGVFQLSITESAPKILQDINHLASYFVIITIQSSDCFIVAAKNNQKKLQYLFKNQNGKIQKLR